PLWQTKDYLEALGKIPNLVDLVKNPFLLTLSLEVLPRLVDPGQMLSTAMVTRVALYDQFVELWLECGKKRLFGKKDLSRQEKKAFERLADEGFTKNGVTFLKGLAAAIYRHQAGNPAVEYSHKQDQETWKGEFFNRDDENQLLLEALFEPQEAKKILDQIPTPARRGSASSMFSFEDRAAAEEESIGIQQSLVDHPLTWRDFVSEPSILQFLAERVHQEPVFKQQLLAMIERSKTDKEVRKAAANAITILVRAGIRFNGADLKGIWIPGADLRKANLRRIWLRQANLSNARMASLQFGEWSYLIEDASVLSCVHSPDGKTCAAGVKDGMISVYDTTTWTKTHTLSGHTDVVRGMVYSPSGHQIASCSHDKTVRLWDVKSGQCLAFIEGSFTSIAWNTIPNSTYFVTGCEDTSVRMWQVTEEENHFQVRLHWSSMHDALVVSNTSIQNVQGLSRINMRLLEQRGAVGEPILPSSFREAGKKLISMASVASKLKLPSNHDTLDTNLTTDSPAVQSAKSVDSADVSSLA
ncbi:hypothetical protein BGZ54_008745, partial [Gamsiella multidivaricata]